MSVETRQLGACFRLKQVPRDCAEFTSSFWASLARKVPQPSDCIYLGRYRSNTITETHAGCPLIIGFSATVRGRDRRDEAKVAVRI